MESNTAVSEGKFLSDSSATGLAAVLVDEIETLLRGLPSAFCQVLELRLHGYGPTKVARRLAVSRMTVQQALSLLRQ